MTLNEFRDLLARWATWIYSANRASNGFVLPTYAEYVGKGSFDREPIDAFDPDVHLWDEFFRTYPLPTGFKDILTEKYLKPRGARKERQNGEHFRRIRTVEECTMMIFDSHRRQSIVDEAARQSCA